MIFLVPNDQVPCINHYLEQHRRVLLAYRRKAPDHLGTENAFWLARSGAPWPSDTFADMISRQMPPTEANIIRIILGHATLVTAERYYIHARRKFAARKH
ncbi:MAG: hypothetical protein JSR21_22270 [Proteobacteria bacterium]|nr:hypothetical protein [Pseudomonadota bacterium]